MTAEMKVKEITINDQDLLSPARKQELEQAIKTCFQKAQQKAQEVAAEKTKEIL
jgi:DNA-binding protein YbaB